MSYTPQHKLHTRTKILKAAGALFKSQGYGATGVEAVMNAAGLTRGGFYAHFSGKLDLFNHIIVPRKIGTPSTENDITPLAFLGDIFHYYLSPEHRDNPGVGCPLPALSGDISKIGGTARNRYNRIFSGFVKIISKCLVTTPAANKDETAESILLMMIGSIIVARALGQGPKSDQVLSSCRRTCEKLSHMDAD